MMKRYFLSLLKVAMLTALILGVGGKLALSEPAKKAPKEILFGATEGFTGPYAAFGQGIFGQIQYGLSIVVNTYF